MLPLPLVQWLSAPLWWIFNKGLFLSPSEELIKVIEARADEPHHPDLEALLSPPPHNYTCIIRTHTHTHTHACTHTHTHVCTHIHIIETAHNTPNQSPSHQFPPVSEPVNHHGAATDSTCRETLSQGGATLFCWDDFYFHSSVLCLCIGFFRSVLCIWFSLFLAFLLFPSLSHLSPLFSASLCVSASHCLQPDVMASVQNRRRLGIWWCGACKWSLCQGCLF